MRGPSVALRPTPSSSIRLAPSPSGEGQQTRLFHDLRDKFRFAAGVEIPVAVRFGSQAALQRTIGCGIFGCVRSQSRKSMRFRCAALPGPQR